MRRRRLVAESWNSFEREVLNPGIDPIELKELRWIFYAGATGLFGSIMSCVSGAGDDYEPSEEDLSLMGEVQEELREFSRAVTNEPEFGRDVFKRRTRLR